MPHTFPSAVTAGCRRGLVPALLLAVVLGSACGPVYVQDDPYYGGQAQAVAPVGQTAQVDFSYLGAYGTWTNSARWGRVWVPAANQTPGWRPYYHGQWDYTDYGWTWVSAESWGWGPYHYGRWAWDNAYRWVWVPGYTWAPAWVSWRSGGGCVGWAPLGPRGVVFSHHTYWTFVSQQHIHRRNVRSVLIPHTRVASVYRQTVRVGNTGRIRSRGGRVVTYQSGPSRSVAQSWTRTRIQPRNVQTIPSAVPRARGNTRRPAGAGYRTPGARSTVGTRATGGYRAAPSATVRPGPSRGYATRPAYRPGPATGRAYRPAPATRPGRVAPTYRPAPGQAARPRGTSSTRPTYRPAPSARPAYRPGPSGRAAPSGRSAPRASPGRAAPGYGSRANAYRAAPRARASSKGSSRPSARSSRSSSSSKRSRSSSSSRSRRSR